MEEPAFSQEAHSSIWMTGGLRTTLGKDNENQCPSIIENNLIEEKGLI